MKYLIMLLLFFVGCTTIDPNVQSDSSIDGIAINVSSIDPEYKVTEADCYNTVKAHMTQGFDFDFNQLIFSRMKCNLAPAHYVQFEAEGRTTANEPFYVHFFAAGGSGGQGGASKCLIIDGERVVSDSIRYSTQETGEGCKWV
ncbi:hypothetical protein KY329_04915 [Candidatus Woesearchaeota archaeon]|nr:hypothetical protein [Candidatus Woesearchaeota archaeon]